MAGKPLGQFTIVSLNTEADTCFVRLEEMGGNGVYFQDIGAKVGLPTMTTQLIENLEDSQYYTTPCPIDTGERE